MGEPWKIKEGEIFMSAYDKKINEVITALQTDPAKGLTGNQFRKDARNTAKTSCGKKRKKQIFSGLRSSLRTR